MLVADGPDAYRFVTQPDHGRQVRRFADHWGTERFASPTPTAAVRMAAALHDAGWYDYDLAPHLVDGRPAGVLDTTREEWTRFYDHGIRTVAERDPYAGLLCAMHGAGVRKQRYGTQSDLPDTADEFAAFVDAQERRQQRLLDELSDHTVYASHVDDADRRVLDALHDGADVETGGERDSDLYRNYRLLQTWDRLSLYCCRQSTLDRTTVPAPVRPGVSDVELTLDPVADGVRIDPYPFDTAPLTTTVDAPVESATFRFVD
jgi:hypothetical protein